MNGLVRELEPHGVQVLRIDAMSDVGNEIARQYRVRGVPTLIVIDETGSSVLTQVGRLNKEDALQAIAQISP